MKLGKVVSLVFVFAFSLSLLFVAEAEDRAVVSRALDIISKNSHVAMSCVADSKLDFEAEDFERALNLSKITSITVTELPEKSEGILCVGSREVSEGQTISRADIARMSFEFLGENVSESSFCFFSNQGDHEIRCKLYTLKYANTAPIANVGGAEAVSTYKNISCFGNLSAYDKEGDKVYFEVVKQPSNGLLKVDGRGEYVYKPAAGYTGRDSFRYVAVDEYGNYSSAKEIKLEVEAQRSSVVFCDITSEEYHVAAINLTEKGIMSASEIDGEFYFYPNHAVGRLEYLVMAMKSMGISADGNSENTIFYDDAKIPQKLKGYVNTAVKLGYVSGKIDEKGNLLFAPNDKITRAEAAVMLYNMADLTEPVLCPVFADSTGVPSWAEKAINCLASNGILPDKHSFVSASQSLSREEGAYMLYMLNRISE